MGLEPPQTKEQPCIEAIADVLEKIEQGGLGHSQALQPGNAVPAHRAVTHMIGTAPYASCLHGFGEMQRGDFLSQRGDQFIAQAPTHIETHPAGMRQPRRQLIQPVIGYQRCRHRLLKQGFNR